MQFHSTESGCVIMFKYLFIWDGRKLYVFVLT